MLDLRFSGFVAVPSLLLALLGAGCGDSGPQCVIDTDCDFGLVCNAGGDCVPRGGSDGGMDAEVPDAGDAGVDAGDGGETDSGVDAGGPTGRGTITAFSKRDVLGGGGVPESSYIVSASFTDQPVPPTDCTTDEAGPCTIEECPGTPPPTDGGMPDGGSDAGAPVDAGPPPTPPTAGTIDISGGTTSVALTETGDMYPPKSGTQALWTSDATELRARAFGDEVPTFDIPVEAPIDVTVTGPSFVTPPFTIERSAGLTVQWQGSSSVGDVVVRLSQSDSTGASTTITCTYAASSEPKEGAVPALALASLDAGAGRFSVRVRNENVVTVEDWELTFVARTAAKRAEPENADADVAVTFE